MKKERERKCIYCKKNYTHSKNPENPNNGEHVFTKFMINHYEKKLKDLRFKDFNSELQYLSKNEPVLNIVCESCNGGILQQIDDQSCNFYKECIDFIFDKNKNKEIKYDISILKESLKIIYNFYYNEYISKKDDIKKEIKSLLPFILNENSKKLKEQFQMEISIFDFNNNNKIEDFKFNCEKKEYGFKLYIGLLVINIKNKPFKNNFKQIENGFNLIDFDISILNLKKNYNHIPLSNKKLWLINYNTDRISFFIYLIKEECIKNFRMYEKITSKIKLNNLNIQFYLYDDNDKEIYQGKILININKIKTILNKEIVIGFNSNIAFFNQEKMSNEKKQNNFYKSFLIYTKQTLKLENKHIIYIIVN